MVYVKNVPKNIILILTFIKIKMGLTINHPMAENFQCHLLWNTNTTQKLMCWVFQGLGRKTSNLL